MCLEGQPVTDCDVNKQEMRKIFRNRIFVIVLI